MLNQNMFTVKEFADVCGVDKSTLIYYDKIGLFSPERIDDNGYRLYGLHQINAFTTISVLRQLNISIKKIRELLADRSVEFFLQCLSEQDENLRNEIQHLVAMRRYLGIKQQLIIEGKAAVLDEVNIVERPNEYFFVTPHESTTDERIHAAYAKLLMASRCSGFFSPHGIGFVSSIDKVREGRPAWETCVYYQTKVDNPSISKNVVLRACGHYVTVYHNQGFFQTAHYLEQLLDHAERAKYIPVNDFVYEDPIIDFIDSGDPDSHIIRQSIHVIPKTK